jgi:tripartite-type tricarboxylate transporter receptor subunit TctC
MPKGRSIFHNAACIPALQARTRTIVPSRAAKRPETRRTRSDFAPQTRRKFLSVAPPDGYTLLVNTIPFVTNQFLMPRAPYDPVRDFVSISLVASSPSLVTVHPSVPARSIQELIALAKSKPGQLYYSAAGVGTNPHIAGELFNLLADVNIVAVQFKGGGPPIRH